MRSVCNLLASVVLSVLLTIPASGEEKPVADIQVTGNDKIEASAILNQIETKVGNTLSTPILREDLKRIYKMGYFTDVQVDVKKTEAGPVVTFAVVEKPSIGQILISGNMKIETAKIREKVDVQLHSIVNTEKIQSGINEIEKLYKSKGYYGAKISYKIEPLEKNEVVLEIKIEEGKKGTIRKIVFKGNDHFSARTLRKKIQTQKRGIFSWITGKGYLDEDMLNNDVDLLTAFYYDEGYLRVKVEKPKVVVAKQGKAITVEFTINEGPQFHVESIDFKGDIPKSKEDLLKLLQTKIGKTYQNSIVQKDILKLTDLYADDGYAYADVRPIANLDDATKGVQLTFEIEKGKKVYFGRINILGNTKTRDKVIRRELRFSEGDLYTSTGIKRSQQRLKQTGYFKNVDLTTSKGSSGEIANMDVKVQEAPTGAFSVGFGFSTTQQFIVQGSLSDRNLFGLGYQYNMSGTVGGQTLAGRIGFTDPYFLGYPVSAGINLFATDDTWYAEYSQKTKGVSLSFGKELGEYLRGTLTYTFENINVYDVTADASPYVASQAGVRNVSLLGFIFNRDTRDDYYFPTRGGTQKLGLDYAGGILGGDDDFYRATLDMQYYHPLVWKFIGHVRGLFGFIQPFNGQPVHIYDAFYVGGTNSIRGYDWGMAGPKDVQNNPIGGSKEALANFEIQFPIREGLRGLVFYDVGKGFNNFSGAVDGFSPVAMGAGVGIRWLTPMGPFALDFGFNLNPQRGERSTAVSFFMGGPF